MSFSTAIKKEMAKYLPLYSHVDTWGGSGPVLTFVHDLGASYKFLQSSIFFQKGLHGANWFRVEIELKYLGLVKNGGRGSYNLFRSQIGQDVDYSSSVEGAIKKWFLENHELLAKELKVMIESGKEKYQTLSNIYDHLLEKYLEWYKKEGFSLSQKDYQEEDEDPESSKIFESFSHFLKTESFLNDAPAQFHKLHLWHFWESRPRPMQSFVKNEYDLCTVCKDFKSRGSLIEKNDPVFGKNYEFVCQKCAVKMDKKLLFKKG